MGLWPFWGRFFLLNPFEKGWLFPIKSFFGDQYFLLKRVPKRVPIRETLKKGTGNPLKRPQNRHSKRARKPSKKAFKKDRNSLKDPDGILCEVCLRLPAGQSLSPGHREGWFGPFLCLGGSFQKGLKNINHRVLGVKNHKIIKKGFQKGFVLGVKNPKGFL